MPLRIFNIYRSTAVLLLAITVTIVSLDLMAAGTNADTTKRVWPPPPAPARLAFIRQITGPDDLGVSKGLIQQLGELISGPTQVRLVRPTAIVEGPDGALFIADPGVRGVHLFNLRKNRYRLIKGRQGQALPSPVALAVGTDGEVYVSDSRLAGVFMIKPGASEAVKMPLQGLLAQPTGLAVSPSTGQLYVVDTGSHDIKVFGKDGSRLSRIGHRGTGAGEFNFPTMIWMGKHDRLLVADSMNLRVQILDISGRFLGQFGTSGDGAGQMAQPKGIAMDSQGHVYVIDGLLHTMQVFDTQGTFLLKLGQRGEGIGEFWLPAGIFIGAQDTIYIADSYNGRVQVFRYIGGAAP